MKWQKGGLGILMVVGLLAGCKAMYNDYRQSSGDPDSDGVARTNDVFVNVHLTNKSPEKVTVKIEATNLTPTVKMQVKVDVKEPKETTVPLKLDVTASNQNPVKVSMTVSNASGLIVPVTLSTDAVKGITIPVKIGMDANTYPLPKIPSEIVVKLDDDSKALLKNLASGGSAEPGHWTVTKYESEWLKKHACLVDLLILSMLIACFGAAGGGLRTVLDEDLNFRGSFRNVLYRNFFSNLSFWRNVIFGVAAAVLVPIALYFKDRKIFELGMDPLLLLILISGCFAAGLIGAVFVQWFYKTAGRMFQ